MTGAVRRIWIEWLILCAALCALSAAAYHQQWAWRADLAIYDIAIANWSRPAPTDVVIVAIDDVSVGAIGRWPWPRKTQARLIERISAGQPRVVGLDLILTEPDSDPAADRVLGAALASLPRLVIATIGEEVRGTRRFVPPIPAIAALAPTLGHIHVEIDPDAVVRTIYLREGPNTPDTPHLAVAMREAHRGPSTALPGQRRGRIGASTGLWQRDHWYRIPFAGPPGHVERISAASLINDKASADRLRDKYVLVGATAAGLGDGYAVPTSGAGRLMPGVEINAQVLDALGRGIDIRDVPQSIGIALTVALVICTLLSYLWVSPRAGLLVTAAVAGCVVTLAVVGPRAIQVWFAPSAALGALILCYPLWSWRRLEASLVYMRGELRALKSEPQILPVRPQPAQPTRTFVPDAIEQAISAVQRATEHTRALNRFVLDSLDRQADGVIVTDLAERVALCNTRAATLTGLAPEALRGAHLRDALQGVEIRDKDQLLNLGARPADGNTVTQIEGRALNGEELLISVAECKGAGGGAIGYIVNLTDVSVLKAAANAREEAMGFLSHDLRAPQAAIVTAIELRRAQPAALPEQDLLAHIERSARRTLGLAEAFVMLTRADHLDERSFVPIDLVDLAREMGDEAWPLSRTKSSRIEYDIAVAEAWVSGDRALLGTALLNLINNAIKYSPSGTCVTIGVESKGGLHIVSVRDEGHGIDPADIAQLFQRFRRLNAATRRGSDGAGLGLLIVDVITRKHGGTVAVQSQLGQGSTFSMQIPAA